MEKIVVGIAEGKTAVEQQVLISYALGSCACMIKAGKLRAWSMLFCRKRR